MLEFFKQIHWPTFFISLTFFIIASSIWSLINALILKKRAEKRVREVEKASDELQKKLRAEDQEIQELMEKFKSSFK